MSMISAEMIRESDEYVTYDSNLRDPGNDFKRAIALCRDGRWLVVYETGSD